MLRAQTSIRVSDRAKTLFFSGIMAYSLCIVVRSSYADKYYTKLALDAIAEWKNTDEWKDTYREYVTTSPNSRRRGLTFFAGLV